MNTQKRKEIKIKRRVLSQYNSSNSSICVLMISPSFLFYGFPVADLTSIPTQKHSSCYKRRDNHRNGNQKKNQLLFLSLFISFHQFSKPKLKKPIAENGKNQLSKLQRSIVRFQNKKRKKGQRKKTKEKTSYVIKNLGRLARRGREKLFFVCVCVCAFVFVGIGETVLQRDWLVFFGDKIP